MCEDDPGSAPDRDLLCVCAFAGPGISQYPVRRCVFGAEAPRTSGFSWGYREIVQKSCNNGPLLWSPKFFEVSVSEKATVSNFASQFIMGPATVIKVLLPSGKWHTEECLPQFLSSFWIFFEIFESYSRMLRQRQRCLPTIVDIFLLDPGTGSRFHGIFHRSWTNEDHHNHYYNRKSSQCCLRSFARLRISGSNSQLWMQEGCGGNNYLLNRTNFNAHRRIFKS
jgi:hypothetical protein